MTLKDTIVYSESGNYKYVSTFEKIDDNEYIRTYDDITLRDDNAYHCYGTGGQTLTIWCWDNQYNITYILTKRVRKFKLKGEKVN